MTYDAEGNMTYGPLGGTFASFEYDQLNQLTSAGGTMYTYDGEGTRVTRGGITYVTDPVSELSHMNNPLMFINPFGLAAVDFVDYIRAMGGTVKSIGAGMVSVTVVYDS